jgi:hypothetical protein
MSKPTSPAYKTKNWPAYSEPLMRHWFEQSPIAAPSVQARWATANALKRRGSLTIWFDPTMTWDAAPTGKRGRQPDYSDAAIQTCLTMKVLFGMALRQTTGFVESLLRLIDLDWPVPNFSTLSRRQKTLKVNIPYRGSQGPLHLLIDSTGFGPVTLSCRPKCSFRPPCVRKPRGFSSRGLSDGGAGYRSR